MLHAVSHRTRNIFGVIVLTLVLAFVAQLLLQGKLGVLRGALITPAWVGSYTGIAGDVVINEIAWAGANAATDQYIEVRNMTSTTNTNPIEILKNGNLIATISTGALPGNDFYVITRLANGSTMVSNPDLSGVSTLVLDTTNVQYQLRDTLTNNILDTADDGVGAPFDGDMSSGRHYAMERNIQPYSSPTNANTDGQDPTYWHTAGIFINGVSSNIRGTPKEMNGLGVGDLIINEINWVGNPNNPADQWFELRNMTNQNLADLPTGAVYMIRKTSGSTTNATGAINGGSLAIAPHGYATLGSSISFVSPAHNQVDNTVTTLTQNVKYELRFGDSTEMFRTTIDTADDGAGTPLAGNQNLYASMERNIVPYSSPDNANTDGQLAQYWHTATRSANLDNTPNATPLATPQAQNSPEFYINELNWMGSSAAPDDYFIEIKKTDSDTLWPDGSISQGTLELQEHPMVWALPAVVPNFIVGNISSTKDFVVFSAYAAGSSSTVIESVPANCENIIPFGITDFSNKTFYLTWNTPYGNYTLDSSGAFGTTPFAGDNNGSNRFTMERNLIPIRASGPDWHTAYSQLGYQAGTSPDDRGTPCHENSLWEGDIVINEVMWMGTSASTANDDWVELRNMTTAPLSFDSNYFLSLTQNPGWSFTPAGSFTIQPGDFYVMRSPGSTLLNASDNASLPTISNTNVQLELSIQSSVSSADIDIAGNNAGGWFSGNETNYHSMERTLVPYSHPEYSIVNGQNSTYWQTSEWSQGFSNYSGNNPPPGGTTPLGTPHNNNSYDLPTDITFISVAPDPSLAFNLNQGRMLVSFNATGNSISDTYTVEVTSNGGSSWNIISPSLNTGAFPTITFTHNSLADEILYNYRIRVTNTFGASGNWVTSTNTTETYDRSTPVITPIAQTPISNNMTNIPITFTSNEAGFVMGSTATGGCIISGNPIILAGSNTINLTIPSSGSYTCRFDVYDSAGTYPTDGNFFDNYPAGGIVITVDNNIPTISSVNFPSPSNDSTPTITFTVSDSGSGIDISTVSFSIDGNTYFESSPELTLITGTMGSTNTTWSFTSPSLNPDGSYPFTISAEDTANNGPATDISSIIIDTTAPGITLNSGPAAINNNDPVLNFSISDNLSATGNLQITTPCTIVSSPYALPGAYNLTVSLANGTYSGCQIQLTDLAGNSTMLNLRSPVNTFVIDTTAPGVSSLDIVSTNATPTLATTGDSVTVNFIADEALTSSPTISIPNFAVVNASMIGSGSTWSYSRVITGTESTGIVNFTISMADLIGNTSTADNSDINGPNGSVTLTFPTPLAVLSYSPSQLVRNGTSLTITMTLSEASEPPFISIAQPGGPTIPLTAMNSVGPLVYDFTYTPTAASSGNATVSIIDGAGGVLEELTVGTDFNISNTIFNIDNDAPALAHVTVLPALFMTNSFNYTFNYSDNFDTIGDIGITAGSCSIGVTQTNFSPLLVPTPTSLSITVPGDGVYSCTLEATDDVGNTSSLSLNFTVDTTPPTLTPGSLSIVSDFTDPTLSKNGNIITLNFQTSEPIHTPAITFFGGLLPNPGSVTDLGGQTSWQAQYTIAGFETQGYIAFSITFQDLALIPTPSPYDESDLAGSSVIYDRQRPTVSNFTITNILMSTLTGDPYMDTNTAPNNGSFNVQVDVQDIGPIPATPTSGVDASSIDLLFESWDNQGYQTPAVPITFNLVSGNTYEGVLNLNSNPLIASDDYNFSITVADNLGNTYDENSIGFIAVPNIIIDYLAPERDQSFTGFTATPPGAWIIGRNSAYLPGEGAILGGFLYPKDDLHYETFSPPPPSGIGVQNHPGFPDGIHHYEITFQKMTPVPGSIETLPWIYSNANNSPTGAAFLLNEYPLGSGNILSNSESYEIIITAVDLVGHRSSSAIDPFTGGTAAIPLGPDYYVIPPQIDPYNASGAFNRMVVSFSEPVPLPGEDRNRYEIFMRLETNPAYAGPVLSPVHTNVLGLRTFDLTATGGLRYCTQARAVNVYPLDSIPPLDLSLYGPYTGEVCDIIQLSSGPGGYNPGDFGGGGGGGGGGNGPTIGTVVDHINEVEEGCSYNFVDVASNHPHAVAIEKVCALHIMQGIRKNEEAQLFYPNNGIFRSELAKVLLLGLKKLTIDFNTYFGLVPVFPDIEDSYSWENGATYLVKNMEIMNGYENGNFGPHDQARHLEIIKVLIDTAGLPIEGIPQYTPLFRDIDGLVPWQTQYLNAALHYHIIENSERILNANGAVDRGMIAEYILRTRDASETYKLSLKP